MIWQILEERPLLQARLMFGISSMKQRAQQQDKEKPGPHLKGF